jgi:hypothetical protein
MKVKELKKWLKDFDENLEVVIGDYDKIANEDDKVFHDISGLEQLTSDNKKEFVSIHF